MKSLYLANAAACSNRSVLSFFFSISMLLCAPARNAQDVLMGLAPDGGIEGKGTLYSIKTDNSKTKDHVKKAARRLVSTLHLLFKRCGNITADQKSTVINKAVNKVAGKKQLPPYNTGCPA